MVTLRDVMTEDVLTLEPAMSLRDARSALTRAGVAGADVVARAEQPDESGWDVLEEHSVEEVMSRGAVALPPETAVEEAARRMTEADVHRILVVREGSLVGVVSSRDVVRALAEHGLAE